MDAAALQELQAPLKARYRQDPEAAQTPMGAFADFSDGGITATVRTWAGPVRAGFHTATGGDGSDACTGDMLLQALVGCTGVTLRSVATAMGIEIRGARLSASAIMDARGTLGVSPDTPVGLQQIGVTVELDSDADDRALAKLAQLTERYCVVGQTLTQPPHLTIRRSTGA